MRYRRSESRGMTYAARLAQIARDHGIPAWSEGRRAFVVTQGRRGGEKRQSITTLADLRYLLGYRGGGDEAGAAQVPMILADT